MSKREIVIRVDTKTVLFAVTFLTIGFVGSKVPHLAGKVARHLPHPRLGAAARVASAGPPVLVLCDFETQEEAAIWKMRGVKFTRVGEHATHGQWAARFSYPANQQGPAALIEDALEDHTIRSDWSGYSEIAFEIFNPQTHQERVILQMKDAEGRVSKQNLYLNPESSERVRVSLDEVKTAVDISQVAQFNLFRWAPDHAATFYVDHIRLVRSGAPAEAPAAPAVAPAAGAPAAAAVQTAAGFVLGIEDGTTKVFREPASFQGSRTTKVAVQLARNEIESFQIALYVPETPLANVQIERSELLHENGQASISREHVRVRQVRYVETTKPDYPVSHIGWWPDPLVDTERVNVEPGEVQPLWVTVRAPADAAPGRYTGTLTLQPSAGEPVTIQMDATVWDFSLPTTSHLKTAFDFYWGRFQKAYQNWLPEAYARWEQSLGELQHRYFLDLLDHRISPIWSANPVADTSFDARMSQYLERGLTVFGVGENGGNADNNWPTDQAALDAIVAPYRDIALFLERRGWLDRAYVYTYDEPAVGDPKVAQAVAAVHWAAPGLKNLVVLHDLADPSQNPPWWKDIDIVCVRNTAVTDKYLDVLRQWRKEIWLYVSGPSHPYPTLVLDYPAMSARILPWMCWRARATGLLYWCVNYWTKNPWEDPQNTKWGQNGNGSIMYPGADGPVDSIRLEALRDGMEDYEYLYLLRQLADRAKANPAAQELVAKAEVLLAIDPTLVESMRTYSQDPAVLERNRVAIAELIQNLQKWSR